MNAQLTEAEYKSRIEHWQEFSEAARTHLKKGVRRHARIVNAENSTGDAIQNCKNCRFCFYGHSAEDCAYLWRFVGPIKDAARSAYIGINSERIYNCMAANRSNTLLCSIFSSLNMNCAYLNHCESCSDCFGSTALKHKKFCILNQQYTEEEYRVLRGNIIEDMRQQQAYGEFLPAYLSEFGYHETLAMEYFPLRKEDAVQKGFAWRDAAPITKGQKTIKEIPHDINMVSENITKEILACAACEKNYKITPYELSFYKKMDIPLPKKCFDCRHKDRVARMNPFKLWERTCGRAGCHNSFETSYAPDRKEVVYCDNCYKNAVY